MNIFGETLELIRLRQNLTQTALAREIGIRSATYRLIEVGQTRTLSKNVRQVLAHDFGEEFNDLLHTNFQKMLDTDARAREDKTIYNLMEGDTIIETGTIKQLAKKTKCKVSKLDRYRYTKAPAIRLVAKGEKSLARRRIVSYSNDKHRISNMPDFYEKLHELEGAGINKTLKGIDNNDPRLQEIRMSIGGNKWMVTT